MGGPPETSCILQRHQELASKLPEAVVTSLTAPLSGWIGQAVPAPDFPERSYRVAMSELPPFWNIGEALGKWGIADPEPSGFESRRA